MRLSTIASATAITVAIAFCGAPATAKTVKECNAEYAANKDAIKGAGQRKADFMAACKAGTETIPGGAEARPTAPAAAAPASAATSEATGKSAKDCNAEYAANKDAIKAGGQKKKDFVAACRAGTETIPAATAPAAPASAPAATPAPAPAPASTAAAPITKPAPVPMGGGLTEAQVKAKCPADTVVWVNAKSRIYHFAGTHNYGTTKQGAYMCEADAKAAGDRAAENEKHP